MRAPEWLAILVVAAAWIAGLIASALVSIGSKARGESLVRMWAKQGCFATLATFGVLAVYFLVFNLVRIFVG